MDTITKITTANILMMNDVIDKFYASET